MKFEIVREHTIFCTQCYKKIDVVSNLDDSNWRIIKRTPTIPEKICDCCKMTSTPETQCKYCGEREEVPIYPFDYLGICPECLFYE